MAIMTTQYPCAAGKIMSIGYENRLADNVVCPDDS